MRILIGRTDHIGDMIFTLPMAGLLKQYHPDCTVHVLAKNYVKDIALASSLIDQFLSWDELSYLPFAKAAAQLSLQKYDVFISASLDKTMTALARKAGIPFRIVMNRMDRLWLSTFRLRNQLQGNHFIEAPPLRHQILINTYFLKPLGISLPGTATELLPFLTELQIDESEKPQALLDKSRFNLVIHPGSYGSGEEWPLEYYCQLIRRLPQNQFNIFVTGSAWEAELYSDYLLKNVPQAVLLLGKTSVRQLIHLLASADGLLAASTGPLHLAAALGIYTLGLYPTQTRVKQWEPLGPRAEYIVSRPSCAVRCRTLHCICMKDLRVDSVRDRILSWVMNRHDTNAPKQNLNDDRH